MSATDLKRELKLAASLPGVRMAMTRVRRLVGDAITNAHGRYVLDLATDNVDAWYLLSGQAQRDIDHLNIDEIVNLVQLSEIESVFEDVVPAIVEDVARDIGKRQRELLKTLGMSRPLDVAGAVLDSAVEHCDMDPYDEALVAVTARGLAGSGERREAIRLITKTAEALVETGLELGRDLAKLQTELLEIEALAPTPESEDDRPRHVRGDKVPERLRDLLSDPYIGSAHEFDDTLAVLDLERKGLTGLVVSGSSGAGKSRLQAAVAAEASAAGWRIVSVTATQTGSSAAFAPFQAALPDLHRSSAELASRDYTDAETRRSAFWTAARAAIHNDAARRPTLVLIDDAQWLDSHSADFVCHLLGSTMNERTAVVITGRDESTEETVFRTICDAAKQSRFAVRVMRPFNLAEIQTFAENRLSLSRARAVRIADELFHRTRGLPGAASLLLSFYDPNTGRLPDTSALSRLIYGAPGPQGLSEEAFTVGAIASIWGTDIDYAILKSLSNFDSDQTLKGIHELIVRGLMTELSPTRFRIRHNLVEAAFLASSPRPQIASWHARAAEHPTLDVHARARHLVEAIPYVEAEHAADALVASAEALIEEGLALEACRAYERASTVRDTPLSYIESIGYSRALDLHGSHTDAQRVRSEAFTIATRNADHWSAFRLATSGLPEAEPIDGSEQIIELLYRIDAASLVPRQQWHHAHQLARQNAIGGKISQASTWAATATALATTPDQLLQSILDARLAISATSTPQHRQAILDETATSDPYVADAIRANAIFLRAIDAYEAGDTALSRNLRNQIANMANPSALQQWHLALFDCAEAADNDETDAVERLRSRAHQLASRAGIREADNAFLASLFADLFVINMTHVLQEPVRTGMISADHSPVTRAGIAVIQHAAGQHDQAYANARIVVEQVHRSPVSQGIAAVAVVAELVAELADEPLRHEAEALLASRGNSIIVVGAAVASLGPVQRYLAKLSTKKSRTISLLQEAVCLADNAALTRWSRICRTDLAKAES